MDLLSKKNTQIFLFLLGIGLLVYFSFLLVNVLVLIAVSVLLAFIFAPFVRLLEGQGFSRTISTLMVFIVFGFLVYFGLSFVIPKFFSQMDQVVVALKDFSLNEELNDLEKKILSVFPLFHKGELSLKVQGIISTSFNEAINHITQYVSGIVSIAAFLVVGMFLLRFVNVNRIMEERKLSSELDSL